jgi:hypothetical protein
MNTGMELPLMAKQRGRPKSDRDDVSAKIDRSLVSKAKLLAAHRGVSAAEVISELLQAPLDRAYAQMLRELEGGSK